MNLSEMKRGDVIVCTATEESINDFSIFGLVVANNSESNSMLIRRYVKKRKSVHRFTHMGLLADTILL